MRYSTPPGFQCKGPTSVYSSRRSRSRSVIHVIKLSEQQIIDQLAQRLAGVFTDVVEPDQASSSSQQTGARKWAHRGARRFGGGHLLCSPQVRGNHSWCSSWLSPERPWCLEPVSQHGGGGLPREPWIGALSPCVRLPTLPALPTTRPSQWATAEGVMQWTSFTRAARDWNISKKDAKVCVRINGAGRRKTSETVTTFGATTRQIMSLRDHLAAQRVTCVVMEATGDYWKPFYYLLEDLPGSGSDAGQCSAREEPAGPQDRCRRRNLARSARRTRTGSPVVCSTGTDPAVARPDPHPYRGHPGAHPRDPAAGKTPRRRRDQTVLGGLRPDRGVRAGDAGSLDCRRTPIRWPWPSSPRNGCA